MGGKILSALRVLQSLSLKSSARVRGLFRLEKAAGKL
jgi:hypothetical protein